MENTLSIQYECVPETGSTNTDLLNRAKKEILSAIVVRRAINQTNARGTRGRHWDGGDHCLMFSVAVPIGRDLREISGVTLAIGTEVVESLRKQGVKAEVKWPNDILLNGKKLAGILVETTKSPDHRFVLVVGIGLNLKDSLRDDGYGRASLADALPLCDIEKPDFWLKLLSSAVVFAINNVRSEGLKRTQALWDTIAAYKNQTVTVLEEGCEPYDALVLGIDETGHLLVRANQEIKVLQSGSISIRSKKK